MVKHSVLHYITSLPLYSVKLLTCVISILMMLFLSASLYNKALNIEDTTKQTNFYNYSHHCLLTERLLPVIGAATVEKNSNLKGSSWMGEPSKEVILKVE